MTWHDWVGKVIHLESWKKLKFDYTNKWYMHNPESVLENETHKLLRDFDIQMNHLISARQPDLIIIKKKERTSQSKTERMRKEYEKRDKYQELAWELKKVRDIIVTVIPIITEALGTVTKGKVQGLENLELKG